MSGIEDFPAADRLETCCLSMARRVAAMLDRDPDAVRPGDPLPHGWQFILMGADARRSALRADGFPGLGLPMPELGLPRLLLVGRTVAYHSPIVIGSEIARSSRVTRVTRKETATGSMAIVSVQHDLCATPGAAPSLVETQTYAMMSDTPTGNGTRGAEAGAQVVPTEFSHVRTFVPDDILLFQYSALGFNSHRIHFDRTYTREVEGYPDLVVNGGLTNLLMMEFLRDQIGVTPLATRTRHSAPLFCGRSMTIGAQPLAHGWRLRALNDAGQIAAEMEVDDR